MINVDTIYQVFTIPKGNKMSFTKIFAGLFLAAIILPASAEEAFKVCADPLNPPYSTKNKDGLKTKLPNYLPGNWGKKSSIPGLPNVLVLFVIR